MSDAILRDFERLGPGVVRRRRKDGEEGSGSRKHARADPSSASSSSSSTLKHSSSEKPTDSAMGASSAMPKRGSRIDPDELSDEQKLALERWQSLNDEQRKDLLAKYNEARSKAVQKKAAEKLQKMEAAYRPKKRQNASTDYDKWDTWAKGVADDDNDDGNTPSPQPSAVSVEVRLMDERAAKIEAFSASFLFSIVFVQAVLPMSMRFTFTKQVLFGAAVLLCFLADRYGRTLHVFGFLWGGSLGAVIFKFLGQSSGVGMIVGGLVGASNRANTE